MKRIILRASEGKVFTNGEAIGKIIYLGVNDSATNWYEIDKPKEEEVTGEDVLFE